MEQRERIINFPKKILRYKTYFHKNIFDEKFLDEKDKALSPIVLSDEIPGEINKKAKKKNKRRRTDFNVNEKKYIKYGPNIIFIGAKIDKNDNDDEIRATINEQIFKIISNGNIL